MHESLYGRREGTKMRIFFLECMSKTKQGVAEEGERTECKIMLGKKRMLQCKEFEEILD